MKKNELIMKFSYDGIIFTKNNKIYNYQIKEAVENNKVINSSFFIKKFSFIIDKLKLNHNLFSNNINIIIDNTYTYEDKRIITNILKDQSFNKINFINISNIIDNNQHSITIELNNQNFKIYYNNITYIGQIYFDNYLSIIDSYLKELIKEININEIYIYGSSQDIKKLITFIEKKYHIYAYFYANPSNYPLSLLIE